MALDTPVAVGTVSINGNDFPVYGTYDRSNEYMAGSLSSGVWDTASEDDQNKSMVMSRRWLDRQTWKGELTSASQETAFPRTGLVDKEGNSVASNVVPLGIEFAQYELQLLLLSDATVFVNANTSDNTRKLKAEGAEIEFFRPTLSIDVQLFPDHIQRLISPFLTSGSQLDFFIFFGGTDEPNNIVELGEYNIVEGL